MPPWLSWVRNYRGKLNQQSGYVASCLSVYFLFSRLTFRRYKKLRDSVMEFASRFKIMIGYRSGATDCYELHSFIPVFSVTSRALYFGAIAYMRLTRNASTYIYDVALEATSRKEMEEWEKLVDAWTQYPECFLPMIRFFFSLYLKLRETINDYQTHGTVTFLYFNLEPLRFFFLSLQHFSEHMARTIFYYFSTVFQI